jgi:hypothetical protein
MMISCWRDEPVSSLDIPVRAQIMMNRRWHWSGESDPK